MFRIAPVVATCMALHYLFHMLIELTPTELDGRLSGLHSTLQLCIGVLVIGSVATFRHLVPVLPVREQPPTRNWLIRHYGIALAVCGIAILARFFPATVDHDVSSWLGGTYMLIVGGVSLLHMERLARAGEWAPGGLNVRYFDLAVTVLGIVTGLGIMFLMLFRGLTSPQQSGAGLIFHTAFGVCFALPFVVRMLAHMVRVVVLAANTITFAAVIYLGGQALANRIEDAELRRLVNLAAVLLLAGLLASHRALMQTIFQRKKKILVRLTKYISPATSLIEWIVFGRNERAELQAFLATLSPELGTVECCRRSLAKVVQVMELRGAGIVLFRNSAAVVHGTVDLEPVRALWSERAPEELPQRAFAGAELRELPLPVTQALIKANVVGVFPIFSHDRHWGHMFISTGFLETATNDDNVAILQAFADQLALVLDGAALLARAVGVERTLAHAEKLAAIGELAARIAHEIRNPVTAARSLAQQLAREPQSPYGEEHALILEELERVERQVAALLRFARKEEFRFEPVDLGELARTTADGFHSRLEAAGIEMECDTAGGIIARADREKLRQVFVNLIENAIDALQSVAAPRRLSLRVGSVNGTAQLEVADNGPGAPPEVVSHLFEPFFSRKEHGTGLGLAIAKRTIDAHGGRISVRNGEGQGLAMHIELPLGTGA
jgi:signal transduction histidine kinase